MLDSAIEIFLELEAELKIKALQREYKSYIEGQVIFQKIWKFIEKENFRITETLMHIISEFEKNIDFWLATTIDDLQKW